MAEEEAVAAQATPAFQAGWHRGAAAPAIRVFYPVSVAFKGSGFYATDYGRGTQKSEAATSDGDGVKASDDTAKKTAEKSTNKAEP